MNSIVLSVFVLLASFVSSGTALYHYGTNEPYHPGDLDAIKTPEGCTVVHLDMVLRHGSRYPCNAYKEPMYKVVREINKIYERNSFSYGNLTLPWTIPNEYKSSGNCEQSEAGNEEIFLLAKRFRSKYPALFNKTKSWNAYYRFEASDTPRSSKSAVAFSMGLFDDEGTLDGTKYHPVAIKVTGPSNDDKELRYFDACPRYIKEITNGPGLEEYYNFSKGPELKRVIANINTRLNLQNKIPLDTNFIYNMFWFCAYATMNKLSGDWCSVFDQEDLNILDYYDDLWAYYAHSYGNEISYKTNCPLVSDIVNSLDSFVSNKEGLPFGTFRITHIGTIVALQSLFGMYNDSVALRADNYGQQSNRSFRVSVTVPMAANLALVLYRCGKDYKVQALMNERPALLPCCTPHGNSSIPCSMEKFMSCYKHIQHTCNFKAMCMISPPVTASAKHPLLHGWLGVGMFLWSFSMQGISLTGFRLH